MKGKLFLVALVFGLLTNACTASEEHGAAHCAVCIDEALTAYKLEKEEKLNPEQLRQRIIAPYAARREMMSAE